MRNFHSYSDIFLTVHTQQHELQYRIQVHVEEYMIIRSRYDETQIRNNIQ